MVTFLIIMIYCASIAYAALAIIIYYKTIKPFYEYRMELKCFKMDFEDTFGPMIALSTVPFAGFGIGIYFFVLTYLVKITNDYNITISGYFYKRLFGTKDENEIQ